MPYCAEKKKRFSLVYVRFCTTEKSVSFGAQYLFSKSEMSTFPSEVFSAVSLAFGFCDEGSDFVCAKTLPLKATDKTAPIRRRFIDVFTERISPSLQDLY